MRGRWQESHNLLQGHAAKELMTCQKVPIIKSFTTSFQCHTGHPTFGGHSRSKYYLGSMGVHVQIRGDAPFEMTQRLLSFRTSVVKQLLRCLIVFVFLFLNYNLCHHNESGNISYFYFKRYLYYRCS